MPVAQVGLAMSDPGRLRVLMALNGRCKTKVIHIGFDDAPKLGKEAKTEEEALSHYRAVRDEIRAFIETLPETLRK